MLKGREDVRIGYPRAKRVPSGFQRRTRDGCSLRINFPFARDLRGTFVLRFLQLRRERVVIWYGLFSEKRLSFVAAAYQFVKRNGRAGRVMAAFSRTARALRYGVKDSRVGSSWVFFLRGRWYSGVPVRDVWWYSGAAV